MANGKVFIFDGKKEPREATWQEAYGMSGSIHAPAAETVRYVRWLEGRITKLEELLVGKGA